MKTASQATSDTPAKYGWEIPLFLGGILLLANPIYLGRLSIYPLVGWGDLPLFSAGLAVLGVLGVLAAVVMHIEYSGDVRAWIGISVATVPAFAMYDILLSLVWLPSTDAITGFFHTQLIVGSLIVAAFSAGALFRAGYRWSVGIPVLNVLPYIVIYLTIWQFDPILEPAVDLLIFFTDDRILGIPYLGTILVLIAGVLGWRVSTVE